MSQASRLDSWLDCYIRCNGLYPELSRESTTTLIEQPFTALQARSQHLTSLELVEKSGEEATGDNIGDLLELLTKSSQTARKWAPSLLGEASNHKL